MPTKKRSKKAAAVVARVAAKKEIDEEDDCFKNDYLLDLVHRDSQKLQAFLRQVSVKDVRVLFKEMRAAEQDPERENVFHQSLRCHTGQFAALQLVKPYKA